MYNSCAIYIYRLHFFHYFSLSGISTKPKLEGLTVCVANSRHRQSSNNDFGNGQEKSMSQRQKGYCQSLIQQNQSCERRVENNEKEGGRKSNVRKRFGDQVKRMIDCSASALAVLGVMIVRHYTNSTQDFK